MSDRQHDRPDPAPALPLGRKRQERQQARQARVEVDPDLRNYLRAPYDPTYAARAARFTEGAVIRDPPRRGWMRAVAFLIAFSLLSGTIGGVGGLVTALAADRRGATEVAAAVQFLLIASPFGLAGGVLLWRLVRRR